MSAENLALKNVKQIIRCNDCNAVVSVPYLSPTQNAICPRCHYNLRSGNRWTLRRCNIIAVAILFLIPFALWSPLIDIDLLGEHIGASVWLGIWKMATAGYEYTAFLVFICAIFTPIFFVLLVVILRILQVFKRRSRLVLTTLSYIKPWVMFDVYFLSLCVAAFKVRSYAPLELNINLIAFISTTILMTLLFIKLNLRALWEEFYPELNPLEKVGENAPHFCTNCEYTFSTPTHNRKHQDICPRCHDRINLDDNVRLQKTWATLIAGMIMLIPANVLPISYTSLAGAVSGDTLMSGVITFMEMGSYFIAFVVFTASIFVPFSKVIIMLYLLICIQFNLHKSIHFQMKLLHIVHFIGRWSMLDLFVLALMMTLVSRGQIINFSVGPAALYFGSAVFLTMLSTSYFDSRLLWKIYDKRNKQTK
ncbi:paraquat-inducible protein A [Cricetibacter osteomyelitidis]|uniref:Paraquat-inducible protein A n=1 Tax=Cricetibacter osteomyelitidis TaxID=1521931 RepID=A0A4R2SW40_9PAST|nr:paraquat-inducible protein A [Cricetibacter osteomyelitidis]TCP93535.1 paraquat-inducible protein A [Cricetibacter osteomyelitidis]